MNPRGFDYSDRSLLRTSLKLFSTTVPLEHLRERIRLELEYHTLDHKYLRSFEGNRRGEEENK